MLRSRLATRRLAAAVALPLLLAAFHWKLLLGPRAVWFASDDNAYQVLPWLEVQARAWRAGQAPLWDPFQWMGQPLLDQAQPAVASPLNWLLALKPEGAAGWWFLNFYFLCIRWIGAAGMYRLARALACGRAVSVAAGFAYAAAGEFAFSMRPQMAMGAMWAPWALRHWLKSVETPRAARAQQPPARVSLWSRFWRSLPAAPPTSLRHAALGGFFLGLCWLGGHHQPPLFLTLGFALLWLLASSADPRRLTAAAVFFAMAAAAGAAQILPAIEYGRHAVRWVGLEAPIGWHDRIPLEIHRQNSFPPQALPALLLPGFRGAMEAYHGALLLGLGLLGAIALRRRSSGALAVLAVFGVWLSLGPDAGLHRVLYSVVPHFDKARTPAAALLLLSLALPALAAAGAERLACSEQSRKWRATVAALWAAAAMAACTAAWLKAPGASLIGWSGAGAAAVAALVWLGRTRAVPAWAFAVIALAATAAELSPSYEARMPAVQSPAAARYLDLLSSHSDIAGYLRARGGHWRVDVDDSVLPYNFGGWHGLEQHQGYLASVTTNLYRHELHTPQAKRLFGVRFRVAQAPSPPYEKEVFRGAGGIQVYEWEGVLPRAFIVHEAFRIPSADGAAGALYAIRDQIGEKTFLPGPVPALERCEGAEQARITGYGVGRVVVEARLRCRGMLVVTDTWFPGWRATAGGQPAPIYEAYAAVRGVVLEAGDHVVEFRYRPASVLAGGALTALACLAAAACARRRKLN